MAKSEAKSKSPGEFAIPFYEQYYGSVTRHSEHAKELARTNIYKMAICDMR